MMLQSKQTIGAVVLVHDGYRKYLDQCLQSIEGADCVSIVVNGTSNPLSWTHYNPVAIIPRAVTVGNARNIGVASTKTNYIAHIDSDDWVLPGYLAALADVLNKEPETDLVHTDVLEDTDGARVYVEEPLFRHSCACMYRRSVWERMRGYTITLDRQEDTEFVRRFKSMGLSARYLPDAKYVYRRHAKQNSKDRTLIEQALEIIERDYGSC